MGGKSSKWLAGVDLSRPVDFDTTAKIFAQFDTNQDGFLTAEETHKFLASWCEHHGVKKESREEAIVAVIKTLDLDKNNALSREELMGTSQQQPADRPRKYIPSLLTPLKSMKAAYDVVVIGSGYGGSISALRCAKAGLSVCVLERGKEFLPGDFPETVFGAMSEMRMRENGGYSVGTNKNGLYSLESFMEPEEQSWMTVVQGNGVGGTSLINAGVVLPTDPRVFKDEAWPTELLEGPDPLKDYYSTVQTMLGANPFPANENLTKLTALEGLGEVMKEQANKEVVTFHRADVAVSFEDRVHKVSHLTQPACTLCGNCVSGCNVGAKNTTNMNYLADAKAYGANIFAESEVSHVVPATGGGWLVYFSNDKFRSDLIHPDFTHLEPQKMWVRATHVFCAASSLGSTEILMRSQQFGHVTLSPTLGKKWSANGNDVSLGYGSEHTKGLSSFGMSAKKVAQTPKAQRPGPCITGVVSVDMEDLHRSFVVEDCAAPVPLKLPISAYALSDECLMYLITGHAKTAEDGVKEYGEISLGGNHHLRLSWPKVARLASFLERNNMIQTAFAKKFGGTYALNPAFTGIPGLDETRGGIAVHPLGGCGMGKDAERGVVNQYGQVYEYTSSDLQRLYQGLFVVDSAIIPSSLGKNPLLTISALAERSLAHFIKNLPADEKKQENFAVELKDEVPNLACGVCFTETMHGVYNPATGSKIAFVLTLLLEDCDELLKKPDMVHAGYGLVVCEELSLNPMRCINVGIRLFIPQKRANEHHVMTYDFDMVSMENRVYHFHGEKNIGREKTSHFFSPWTDTTTLFVVITDSEGKVVMDGIQIILTVADFMRQLSTMRPIIPSYKNALDGIQAMKNVTQLFTQILLSDYVIQQRVGNSFIPPPSRTLSLPTPEHHLIDAFEIVLPAKRYKNSKNVLGSKANKKGPIVLAHGLAMSGDSFCDATHPRSIAEDLVAAGYDVWLLETRIGNNLPRASQVFSDLNLDTTAKDWPYILAYVHKITGQKPHVLAHCLNSLSFWMSALSSPITRSLCRSVISSTVSFYPIFSTYLDLRAKSHLTDLVGLFPVEGMRTSDTFNPIEAVGLSAVASAIAIGGCGDTTCHALTFLYGPLYKHSHLTEEFHDSLGSKFGYSTLSVGKHVDKCARAGHLVNAQGASIYVTEGTLQAYVDAQIPTLFISGNENNLWNNKTLTLAAEKLNKLRPNSASVVLFPNYTHLDMFVGKTSHLDVTPTLMQFFDQSSSVGSDLKIGEVKITSSIAIEVTAISIETKETSEEKATTTATISATIAEHQITTTEVEKQHQNGTIEGKNNIGSGVQQIDEKQDHEQTAQEIFANVQKQTEESTLELLSKIKGSLNQITTLSTDEIDLVTSSKDRYNYNDDPDKICTYYVEVHTGQARGAFTNVDLPQILYMQLQTREGVRLPLRRLCNNDLQADSRYWDNFHPDPGQDSVDRFILQERDLKLSELESVTLFTHDPNFPRPKNVSFKAWNFQKLIIRSWRRPCTWVAEEVSEGRGPYTWGMKLTSRSYADNSPLEPSWFTKEEPTLPEGTTMGPSLSLVTASETQWQLVVLMVFESDSPAIDKAFTLEGKEISPIHEEKWLGRVLKYYPVDVSLRDTPLTVHYSTPDGRTFAFQVPALNEAPRMMYLCCNGHWQLHRVPETSTEPFEKKDTFLWKHLCKLHAETPINLLIQNGDQIYSDQMWSCTPLQDWVRMKRTNNNRGENNKVTAAFSPAMQLALESFFFDRYCRTFSRRFNLEATATIPTFSMYDDHDIMDGWGSMDEILQSAPVMQGIFSIARRAFLSLCKLLPQDSPQFVSWQNTHKISVFPRDELVQYFRPQSKRTYFTTTPRDSLASWLKLGPLLLVNLDLRSERTPTQVMSEETWRNLEKFYERMAAEHKSGIEHVVVLSTVPLVWPQDTIGRLASMGAKALRMVHIESFMSSEEANRVVREDGTKVWAPLPVDDDMLDYWDHPIHAEERMRLMEQTFEVAQLLKARVTVLAGDAHMAGRAVYYDEDEKQSNLNVVNQIVSSGVCALPIISDCTNKIVGEITVTNYNLKGKKYKHVHLANLPVPGTEDLCVPARNICLVEYNAKNGALSFQIQVERGDKAEPHEIVVAKAGKLEDSTAEKQ